MTVMVCPATVSVPVRGLESAFAATAKSTLPLPEPLLPLVIVIQAALLDAVHAQPLLVVTAAVAALPAAAMLCGVGPAV